MLQRVRDLFGPSAEVDAVERISNHLYALGYADHRVAIDLSIARGLAYYTGPVFEAVACHNPYPFDYFDEGAWNQMVVKCVFTGAPINSIVGLEQRRNPELLQMLRDLVSERHAAGRSVPDAVHAYVDSG